MQNIWVISTYFIQILIITVFITLLVKLLYNWSYHQVWQRLSFLRKPSTPPSWLLALFAISPKTLNRSHALLYPQTGLVLPYSYYIVVYRFMFTLMAVSLALLLFLSFWTQASTAMFFSSVNIVLLIVMLCEPIWLKMWIKYRKKQIIYDIYQLSYHLLYFSDSQMNIYYKLKKSTSYTTTLKRDLEILLIEWTQDADYALQRLKDRLACQEAVSFIDTISALKQHQDETFYELLRERITEYKEQLEIASDSKKETTSYILFVLAGIPILYTFQIFIYPWVKEVQELLLKLN